MITILEKLEHNVDFHQIVDFFEASHIRYALTIDPTVYVSHIRQFWSTARIETTDEGTKILATVDGKLKTISESSIRRNLKLNDKEGISTLPDAESRRLRIAQSSALPSAANKPTSPLRDDSQGEACPTVSGFEVGQDRANIIKTSALPHDSTPRVPSLAADEGNNTIKGWSLDTVEEAGIERSTEKGSNDTEELVNVLTSLDAANILTSGVQVVSVPPAVEVSTVGIPTGSGLVPTASPIFTTASVVTPYSRCKEKELQMTIDGLDRSNEMIAKHLHEYEQAATELTIGEKIELINELVKYQDHHLKILKYQAQQSKPLSKKQQREFYMSVLKSHSRWKTKHFKGMSLEEIREKFILVWKQIEDFVPMDSKEEGERFKRKGLRLEQESPKKMKTSEEVSQEDLKEMMQLVPVEEYTLKPYKEDLIQLWTLVKETLSIRQATSNNEKELWVDQKRLFESDIKDQLWTHTQALMHDPMK
nr:xylulose kinase-1 [Tanacetum cinerariifolium]